MLSLLKRKSKPPVVVEQQPTEPVRRTHQQNIKVSEDCSAAFAALAEAQGISKASLFEDMVASGWRRCSGEASKSEYRNGRSVAGEVAAVGGSVYEERWSYPPDYVSAETLAYRLDCSRSTIDTYVRLGLLPKPQTIGNLQRWDFGQVKAFIKAQNAATYETGDRHQVKKTSI